MKKTVHQQKIEQFMRLAKQDVPLSPEIPSDEVIKLRASLILEETLETLKALGVSVYFDGIDITTQKVKDFEIAKEKETNIVEVADGCADISVVTIGTLSAFGIPDQGLLDMVDDNNLEKFGEGHRIREDGKLIKPPNHRPPDIFSYIEKHRNK